MASDDVRACLYPAQKLHRLCGRCGKARWTRRRWLSAADSDALGVLWGDSLVACSELCHAELHGMTLAEMRRRDLSLMACGVTPPAEPGSQ